MGIMAGMAVLLSPLVFAQSVFANPWTVFGLNTVLIWFALVVILALFGKSIEDKQKKMLQFGSLALAAVLAWTLVGDRFLWQVGYFSLILNVMFLVNTVIIAILLNYGFRWLMDQNGEGKGASSNAVGGWLVSFAIAGVLASSMSYYIWQAGTGKQLLDLLFGPQGILTLSQNRLFVFITTLVLFSWLFKEFNVGGQGDKSSRINQIMAFIIAVNFAHTQDPMGVEGLVWMSEFVIALIFAKGFKASFNIKNGFVAYAFSFLFVDWLASLAFPNKNVLIPSTWDFWTVALLWVIGLLVFVVGGAWIAGKSGAGRWAKEGAVYSWNKLRNLLGRSKLMSSALNKMGVKYVDLPNEYLVSLKKLRLETFTLLSYIQRHDVLANKHIKLRSMKSEIPPVSFSADNRNITPKLVGLRLAEIMGGKKETLSDETISYSMGLTNYSRWIDETIIKINEMTKLKGSEDIGNALNNFINDINIQRKMNTDFEAREKDLNKVKDYFKAKNAVDAYRPFILDMYSIQGVRVRGYGFALKNTIPEVCKVSAIQKGKTWVLDWNSVSKTGDGTSEDAYVEVNVRGYSVEDINKIKLSGSGDIRRYKKKDIVDLDESSNGQFSAIVELVDKDWEFFMRDFERLSYHPNSRTIRDYEASIISGSYNFSGAGFSGKMDGFGYDREAQKNPGFFAYWGRKDLKDTNEKQFDQDPKNPYPGVSLFGLKQFIESMAKQNTKDAARVDKYMREFVSAGYNFPSTQGQTQQQGQAQSQNAGAAAQENAEGGR